MDSVSCDWKPTMNSITRPVKYWHDLSFYFIACFRLWHHLIFVPEQCSNCLGHRNKRRVYVGSHWSLFAKPTICRRSSVDHHSGSSMSHRGPLTAVITTVLGVTLGGLLVWRVYRRKRKPLPSVQKVDYPVEAPPPVEKVSTATEHRLNQPPALEKGWKAAECQTTVLPPAVQIPSSEQLLAVKPVTVSSEDEWQQLWPRMQRELSVYPVLGLDCEWVKTSAVRKSFCISHSLYQKEKSTVKDLSACLHNPVGTRNPLI